MHLLEFIRTINEDTLDGGAGVLVYCPKTGNILLQIRAEDSRDDDSGKLDLFGGTFEEGETSEETARREAKEEGGLTFPEDSLEELGTISASEDGEYAGEPYTIFLYVADQEFQPKPDQNEVQGFKWAGPKDIENATSRVKNAIKLVRNKTS